MNRRKLIECGLERITFSLDGDADTHLAIRSYDLATLRRDVLALVAERDAAGSSMKIDVSMVVDAATEHALPAFQEAWRGVVDRVQAIPRLIAERRTLPCRELWRGTLVVLWDGRVTVCCVDSEGLLQVGDARTSSLSEVWNGRMMRDIRRAHAERRFPALCAMCGEYETDGVSKRFR